MEMGEGRAAKYCRPAQNEGRRTASISHGRLHHFGHEGRVSG